MTKLLRTLWPIPFAATVATALGCAGFVLTRVIDPDVFWHVRTGQWIVAHGALPATDPFLQTQGETPWVLHEWLFQLLMVPPYESWGLEGLRIFGAVAIVILYLSLYRIGRRSLGEFAASVAALGIIGVALSGFVVRPQIASYCLFVPFFGSVVRHYDSGRWQPLVWIPAGMVVWTNLHGGYMVALGVLLVAALAAWVDWWLIPRACGRQSQRSPVPLVACFAASFLAAAVNPYGFGHLLYPFRTMSIWLLPHIAEWRPPAWDSPQGFLLLLLILVFLLFQQYRTRRSPTFDWAVPFSLVFLALQSVRHAPFAAFAIGILLMLRWQLRPAWLGSPAVAMSYVRRVAGRPDPGTAAADAVQLSRTAEGLINSTLIVVMLALTVAATLAPPPGMLRSQRQAIALICGIDAVDYIKRHGITGPGLNDYGFGGYVTYALWPGQKAFIDGRSDMYSDSFAREYMIMKYGGSQWREVFDRYGFNYVVMPKEVPIVQLLIGTGTFARVYEDSRNTVLVRRVAAATSARNDEES